MDSFKRFKEIKKAESVCLIVHLDPDADALSSMVILQEFLMEKFKIPCVDIFADGDIPDNCMQILNNRQINVKTKDAYDAGIILDCPSVERTGKFGALYISAKLKINIDHHATNMMKNCISYFEVASSTCEIVYKLLTYYKYKFSNSQLGKIYAGIITDTDGFSVGAIKPDTFKIAGACVNKIKAEKIYVNFLKNNTLINQRVYSLVVSNLKEYKEGFVISYITNEQLKLLKAKEKDIFGIANQLNTIFFAKLNCFISPRENGWYISLRAKDGWDVATIAKKFGGGGHQGASGFVSDKPLDEIIKDVEKEFKKHLKEVKIPTDQLF